MIAGIAAPCFLPIFGRSGLTRRSTSSDSSPISSTALTLTSSRISSSSASRSGRSPPGQGEPQPGERLAGPDARPSRGASGPARRRAGRSPSPPRGARRGAGASSSAGQRVRWTRVRRLGDDPAARLPYIASVRNGRIGASDPGRSRASAPWSVANAASRSAPSSFREKPLPRQAQVPGREVVDEGRDRAGRRRRAS